MSEETRLELPNIPWKQIVGMRHRLVHDYTNVDLDILWQVVSNEIEPLVAQLGSFLDKSGEG